MARSTFDESSQRAILWWGIGLTLVYAFALIFLLDMVPTKDPEWTAQQVASWYSENHYRILWGAVIAGWTSMFMIPILTVVIVQMARVEESKSKIWSALSLASVGVMALFLALPPIMWGTAAYTQDRVNPEVTAAMHELGTLTLTTTDQAYIFIWVAVSVVCFRNKTQQVPNNPFPRWWGYLSLWITIMFEMGAFAFVPRTGPLAWDGLLVFWSPLTLFGVWITIQSYLCFKAIRGQKEAAAVEPAALGAV